MASMEGSANRNVAHDLGQRKHSTPSNTIYSETPESSCLREGNQIGDIRKKGNYFCNLRLESRKQNEKLKVKFGLKFSVNNKII